MILITFSNNDRHNIDNMNYKICEALVGWVSFKNNEVVVTPVTHNEKTGNYEFNVYVGPYKPEQKSAPWINVSDIDEIYHK